MKSGSIIILLTLFLTSCAQYAVVKTGQQTVKSFIVNPTSQWNLMPRQFSIAGLPTWTVDGHILNTLTFVSEVSHGDTLFPDTDEKKFDTYDKKMLPNEIIELVQSTLVLHSDAKILDKGVLKPIKIGSDQGFEFEFDFVGQDEIPRKAYIAAAKKNEQLHLIIFQATKIHYFDHLIDDVKNIINTAVIKT